MLTQRAERVLQYAKKVAIRSNYISTGHLLLGLIEEPDGVAHHALNDFNITKDKVENSLKRFLPFFSRGLEGIKNNYRMNMIISNAKKEALTLAHTCIGTEHLLLSILGDDGCVARKIISTLANPQELKNHLLTLLGSNRFYTFDPKVNECDIVLHEGNNIDRIGRYCQYSDELYLEKLLKLSEIEIIIEKCKALRPHS